MNQGRVPEMVSDGDNPAAVSGGCSHKSGQRIYRLWLRVSLPQLCFFMRHRHNISRLL
jgi:hypothetical protein